jgi:hypothetical protein
MTAVYGCYFLEVELTGKEPETEKRTDVEGEGESEDVRDPHPPTPTPSPSPSHHLKSPDKKRNNRLSWNGLFLRTITLKNTRIIMILRLLYDNIALFSRSHQ